MKFVIKGKPVGASTEEVRAIAYATDAVLSYHNIQPKKLRTITIEFVDKPNLGKCLKEPTDDAVGKAYIDKGKVVLIQKRTYIELLTDLPHELIHIYFDFPYDKCEKLTSTLCARLRNDIKGIAEFLVVNTYRHAAYIAHTKIAYRPKGSDFYDKDQWTDMHVLESGKKYRKRPRS